MAGLRKVLGPRKTGLVREDDLGHRTYSATYLVQGEISDGPAQAILCPGLPQYGDIWQFSSPKGVVGEADDWAWCRWGTTVEQVFGKDLGPGNHYEVTFKFSTKPDDKACTADQTQDPLLIPPKISGSFQKFREEATKDRFGRPLTNSAFERLKGPQVEFDNAHPIIKIEMPVAQLNLQLLYRMRETVNAYPLWGFPPRCIKLSNIGWERLFYGSCYVYYKWNLEFEVNPETWDKLVRDEGTLALSGGWQFGKPNWVLKPIKGYVPTPGPPIGTNPEPKNPSHYVRYRDRNGDYAPSVLNGYGLPAGQINGYGARAVAVLEPDPDENSPAESLAVSCVTIINGGQGYLDDFPPDVIFEKHPESSNTDDIPALGVAVVTRGQISEVIVTSGGNYFHEVVPGGGTWAGAPVVVFKDTQGTSPGQIPIEYYRESDFLLLGVPLTF